MKLYNAQAPNPWRVRIFLAEKSIEIPLHTLQVLSGETRTPDFLEINSLGEVPALELDDGTVITESIAICRYLEALYPEPTLFGSTPLEQAQIEMWQRRIELQIVGTVGQIGLHIIPFFADRVEQIPEYAASQARALEKKWEWLDTELSDGRNYVAGPSFTCADITGMMALKTCDITQREVPEHLTHHKKWEHSVRSRPSWAA